MPYGTFACTSLVEPERSKFYATICFSTIQCTELGSYDTVKMECHHHVVMFVEKSLKRW